MGQRKEARRGRSRAKRGRASPPATRGLALAHFELRFHKERRNSGGDAGRRTGLDEHAWRASRNAAPARRTLAAQRR